MYETNWMERRAMQSRDNPVKAYRLRNNLTMHEASLRLGVPERTLARWEYESIPPGLRRIVPLAISFDELDLPPRISYP